MVKDVITEDFDWVFSAGVGVLKEDESTTQGHSQYNKAKGKAILLENRLFQVEHYNSTGILTEGSTSEPFSFTPQAQYTKGEGGKLVLLDGDIKEISIAGTDPITGVLKSITEKVTIKAKQHTVKGS